MRLNETLAGDGTRDIVHVLYEPDSFTPLIRLSTTAQGAPKVKPHYMVQAIQAGTPQAGRNDPGTLDALAMMQDSLAGMPEDMRKMMERGVKRVVEQGLSPQMQAIMGEMGQNTNKLFGQIRQGLKEAEQQARTPVTVHFFHTDHLGTPIALTDREGNIVWAARRDPFGNLIEEYNPNGIEQNIGLPGQYLDRETNLYYNRHRYYDPKISAYLNQDPIGLMGGLNLSKYSDSPLLQHDPLGLQSYGSQGGSNSEAIDQILAVGPLDAYRAKKDANTALRLSQESGLGGLHNGKGDAYRHCVWSCLMTQHIGADQAETVGNIHEIHGDKDGQPADERIMDQTNNAVGRKCGLQQNKKDCSGNCKDALSNGELVGLGGKPL